MASFDVAKLLNKITQDIPGINTVLKALAKWDVSALTDVPDGAMQATTDASNRLTIKKKVSGSYTPVAKLMHDVDTVDGYHASTSATANAVAVRNSSGALPGNITGNAVTADTATALATGTVVPVNQGGTGATTASQARENLGVANGADFTAHVATQASPSVEGHVKLDELAADGSNTAAPGGYGLGMPAATQIYENTDLDSITRPGFYSCRNNARVATLLNCPTTQAFSLLVEFGAYGPTQTLHTYNNNERWRRTKDGASSFSEWRQVPVRISDSTTFASSVVAASAAAVKAVNDSAVHITGNEDISGIKNFLNGPTVTDSALTIRRTDSTLGAAPAADRYWQTSMQDSTDTWVSRFEAIHLTNQGVIGRIRLQNKNEAGELLSSDISLVLHPDGRTYATCPHPPDTATGREIATAGWVKSNALSVGDILASLATSRAGCLLMNGAAVSRTTYAKLFALVGTTFGAGNGTTTFNLPDARGRTMQGANGNLMALLAAGLPNITGLVNIGALGGTGSGALWNVPAGVTKRAMVDTAENSGSINLDASRSSSIYGNSTTVQTPAIAVNYFIKY